MAKTASKFLKTHPWKIIQEGFCEAKSAASESIFSLANEYCGARGFFEEGTSYPSLQGCYFNGVYEWAHQETPNAYRGIAKRSHYLVNAVNWLKAEITVDGKRIIFDKKCKNFNQTLDLKSGILTRCYDLPTKKGILSLRFERFLSMDNPTLAYRSFSLKSDYDARVSLKLSLDFETKQWGQKGYWQVVSKNGVSYGNTVFGENNSCKKEKEASRITDVISICAKTDTTNQYLTSASKLNCAFPYTTQELGKEISFCIDCQSDTPIEITQTFCNCVADEDQTDKALQTLKEAPNYCDAAKLNEKYWANFWQNADVTIDGDEETQQGIRFCIFQLQQTYHGADAMHNIGAKGLTGEAYSGHAFWDTETYCLPYYLLNNLTAAKDLLLFRYNTLSVALKRAEMLDCEGACYPIATLNGYEACALWQHASLQLQPSTGVAYGIEHYVKVSGDKAFLKKYGLEMLLQISRFLLTRGQWNSDKSYFGYYCVMGPDEFQMMVNHNCYTNYMAKRTFLYTLSVIEQLKKEDYSAYLDIVRKTAFTDNELTLMQICADKMLLLYDEKTKLFEQHKGFYDLPHIDVDSIPKEQFPLYSHWSYDRLYRNDMIKQPDVLMFMFLHNQSFTPEQKKANYDFYEPRCIHESSLSPSVHSILACEIGYMKAATDFFGFACRMDLDDYNNNTCEGLHTTSIAAAWLNIVYGFGGVRTDKGELAINPKLPPLWKGYSFKITYRRALLFVEVSEKGACVNCLSGKAEFVFCGEKTILSCGESVTK